MKAKTQKDLAQACRKRVPRAQKGTFSKNNKKKPLPGIHPFYKCAKFQHD